MSAARASSSSLRLRSWWYAVAAAWFSAFVMAPSKRGAGQSQILNRWGLGTRASHPKRGREGGRRRDYFPPKQPLISPPFLQLLCPGLGLLLLLEPHARIDV